MNKGDSTFIYIYIVARSASYDTLRKQTFIPIREMKREYTEIMKHKKVRLYNDVTIRKKPDSISGIHLTTAKVAQYRMLADNRRDK